MQKTWLTILLLAALLLTVKYFFFPAPDTAPAGPAGKTPPTPVQVMVVQAAPLEEILEATGTLLANEAVELRAELPGRITALRFREGSAVQKGELLARINAAELEAQLGKNTLAIRLAEQRLERNRKLLQIQGISQQEFDVLQNELDALRADSAVLRARMDQSEIRAPFSGQIGLRSVSEGAYVTSQQLIATLRQLQPVKLDFSVPEQYMGRLRTGDRIRFTTGASTRAYEGTVYAIEPSVDPATRSIRIRALATGDAAALLPGAFVRVKISLRTQEALLVPTQAVVPVLKGKQLYCVHNGMADTVTITTGIRNDTAVQVLSGLRAGDTVITTGLMQLRPGNAVKIIPGK